VKGCFWKKNGWGCLGGGIQKRISRKRTTLHAVA